MIILTVLITGVVLAALWFFLLDSQLSGLANKQKRFEQAQKKVLDADRLVKRADQIHNELIQASNRLAAIEEEMAAGDLFTWSFKTMEACMAAHKLKVQDSSRPVEGGVGLFAQFPFRAITFTVRTVAYYHDFGVFLRDFENRYPYMRVQNLVLDPSGGSGPDEGEKLKVQFEVVALVKP